MAKEIKQVFSSAEVAEDVKNEDKATVELPPIPDITDKDWSDYVMKHFEPDELVDGNPTAEGLRRVAQLLLGEIVESGPIPVSWPNENNPCSATMIYKVVIDWKLGDRPGLRVFSEIADVSEYNTESEFRKHASATASTRAEGRALRKALKLKHVIAAEENTTVALEEEILLIKSNQVNIINLLCSRNNIDVVKFINSGSAKYDNIEQIPYIKATSMIAVLNKYTSDKTQIPQNLIGYKKDWRK